MAEGGFREAGEPVVSETPEVFPVTVEPTNTVRRDEPSTEVQPLNESVAITPTAEEVEAKPDSRNLNAATPKIADLGTDMPIQALQAEMEEIMMSQESTETYD